MIRTVTVFILCISFWDIGYIHGMAAPTGVPVASAKLTGHDVNGRTFTATASVNSASYVHDQATGYNTLVLDYSTSTILCNGFGVHE